MLSEKKRYLTSESLSCLCVPIGIQTVKHQVLGEELFIYLIYEFNYQYFQREELTAVNDWGMVEKQQNGSLNNSHDIFYLSHL